MKLLIAPPQDDETISSIFDRGASLYGISRECLINELVQLRNGAINNPYKWDKDIDVNPPVWLIRALANAMTCEEQKIRILKIPKTTWLIRPNSRNAYCELCIRDDLERLGTIYFRREWAFSFVTHCPKHLVPLMLWRAPNPIYGFENRQAPTVHTLERWGTYKLPRFLSRRLVTFKKMNHDPRAQEFLEMWPRLLQFEQMLLMWYRNDPNSFDRKTKYIRQLIALVSGNWGMYDSMPVMTWIVPASGSYGKLLFRTPRRLQPSSQRYSDNWNVFVCTGDPRVRRAAIWILSQCCLEQRPLDLNVNCAQRHQYGTINTQSHVAWFAEVLSMLPPTALYYVTKVVANWPQSIKSMVLEALREPLNQKRDVIERECLIRHFTMQL